MFNGSFLRVCRILWFVKKLDFDFLSLGVPSHGAGVWCLGRVPKHRNHWQEVEGLLFSTQNTIGTVFIQGPSIVLLVWRSIMFNGSFFRVCRILRFVKKLDFAFLSRGGPSHGARVWCLGRVPKHRHQWQEVEGLLFSPQNSQLVHILSFHS